MDRDGLIYNKKYDKPNKEYLKGITYYSTEEGKIWREFGFIDFLKIPANELLKVLENTLSDYNKSLKRDKGAEKGIYESNKNLCWELTFIFNINSENLHQLIIAYLKTIKDTKKYETFAKILNETCDLKYDDWLDRNTHNWDDKFFGNQGDVDHEHVSEYHIYLKNRIPLDIIRFMNSKVKMFKIKKEKDLSSWERSHITDREYCQTEQGQKILSLAQGLLEKEESEEMTMTL